MRSKYYVVSINKHKVFGPYVLTLTLYDIVFSARRDAQHYKPADLNTILFEAHIRERVCRPKGGVVSAP